MNLTFLETFKQLPNNYRKLVFDKQIDMKIDKCIGRQHIQRNDIEMNSLQIDKCIVGRQIDKYTDRQIDRQINTHIDRQIDKYTDRQIDRYKDRQIDIKIGRYI